METAIFVVCAAIVLGGAFGVVFSRNPVHSALSLVATLFGIAVLFLNLGAQLLAAVQVSALLRVVAFTQLAETQTLPVA